MFPSKPRLSLPHASRRDFLRHTLVAAGAITLAEPLWAAMGKEPTGAIPFQKISCEGHYPGHLQGVCSNGQDAIFWSYTTRMVRTDAEGRITHEVPAANHHGDLCYLDGKIYVAVNLGKFNQPAGKADSWVYVYDAETLKELARHEVQEVVHGAGGMDAREGHFYVVGGLPGDIEENYVYQYAPDFKFIQRHVIASGQTLLGIQTAAYHDGHWWLGCYGRPAQLLKTDSEFKLLGRWDFDAAVGIMGYGKEKFLVGRNRRQDQGHDGWLIPAIADEKTGLKTV